MELWIATSNQGKLNEFKNLLGHLPMRIHSAGELKVYTSPKENGSSFEENARIKAKSLKALKPGVWVIADDSGLEVDGLGGLPGIHSARYAGPKASDGENMAKLLKMLQIRSPQKREARFKCVMVAYSPEGQEHVFEGSVEGRISEKPSGSQGFGYDPVFVPEGEDKTFSELGQAFKNKVSHRSQAIRQFSQILIN